MKQVYGKHIDLKGRPFISFSYQHPKVRGHFNLPIGLHLDFSSRQIWIHLGILFCFIYFPESKCKYLPIENEELIYHKGLWFVLKHNHNKLPDQFFNIGFTISYYDFCIFFGKYRIVRMFTKPINVCCCCREKGYRWSMFKCCGKTFCVDCNWDHNPNQH